MGAYEMLVSDIFGDNAFLPVLFPLTSILSGQAVLPDAQQTDIYLASLGMLLTSVYVAGLVACPSWRIVRMGLDSLVILMLYLTGVMGLLFLPSH
jgi:cation:H+ antiporter